MSCAKLLGDLAEVSRVCSLPAGKAWAVGEWGSFLLVGGGSLPAGQDEVLSGIGGDHELL